VLTLINLRESLRLTTIMRATRVLPRADRKKMLILAVIQTLLGLLDLAGVVLLGLLGAISVGGVQSRDPSSQFSSILSSLHISNLPFQSQAAILGLSSASLLIFRTVVSILLTRKMLYFLSRRGSSISSTLVSKLLNQPLLGVQERTSQEMLFSVTRGVEYIVIQIIGTSIILFSDISLLIILALGLLVLDTSTAIGTIVFFSLIGISLYQFLHVKARVIGEVNSKLNIQSNEKIVEVFQTYREAVVRNRRDYYAREIGALRSKLAEAVAGNAFLPYISKYVIETAVVLGALLMGFIQFFTQDAEHAVATLAVFLAAGTRIAPAVLRVQQGLIQIKGGLGLANPTLDLIEVLSAVNPAKETLDILVTEHHDFRPEINAKEVSLTYPGGLRPAVQFANLKIPTGALVAVVGPSGAGKTTLIDTLLGIIKPDKGEIFISGLTPLECFSRWPGAISYVPQDVVVINGSILDNVSLGYPPISIVDSEVQRALEIANLVKFVESLPEGVNSQVGEFGAKLSGGQRQRLGIARAMFTNPRLLVLDEATSSLDAETEVAVSNAIQKLKGSVTLIIIAHRLSTVRDANLVLYLSGGEIIASGTFEEVRNRVPDFDRQAKLMGL
jgi:ABC-type multidrug transport system fused ATPase/permease subunit